MNKWWSTAVGGMGLTWMSCAALAGDVKPAAPQEPAGFVLGGVVGGFAAGPVGAVVGAGVGTWLGNRVHRAGEAKAAEARAAQLQGDKNELAENNRALNARLAQLSEQAEQARAAKADPSAVLGGLSGDVLFRTASSELTPEMSAQVQTLAQALVKSAGLKIRLDGYADPRGSDDENLRLSEARANAVRDILVAAGVDQGRLEINAYGALASEAQEGDEDGYALERRVRITLQPGARTGEVARGGGHED